MSINQVHLLDIIWDGKVFLIGFFMLNFFYVLCRSKQSA